MSLKCINCKYYLIDVNNNSVCTILNDKPIGNVARPDWCPRDINNISEVIQPWELRQTFRKIQTGEIDWDGCI